MREPIVDCWGLPEVAGACGSSGAYSTITAGDELAIRCQLWAYGPLLKRKLLVKHVKQIDLAPRRSAGQGGSTQMKHRS